MQHVAYNWAADITQILNVLEDACGIALYTNQGKSFKIMDLWDVIGLALFVFFGIITDLDIVACGHTM